MSITLMRKTEEIVQTLPKKVSIATVCMNAKLDKESNLDTIRHYIKEAKEGGAQLVVFPEIALQQNPGWGRVEHHPTKDEKEYLNRTAEIIPGPSTEKICEIVREHDIYVIFGMTEKDSDGILYNSSVFLGPEGLIGKYRKRDLWDYDTGGNEHLVWTRGTGSGVFHSPLGNVGFMICIEMSLGYGKILLDEGADFLVTVSAWPEFEGFIYEEVTKENAEDNKIWHIVSNQVGVVGHAVDYGHSRVINSIGEIVADTGAEEGMVIATISF